jgi:hypothetical protein
VAWKQVRKLVGHGDLILDFSPIHGQKCPSHDHWLRDGRQGSSFRCHFKHHGVAIDPTNLQFVKTEGMQKLMEEIQKQSATRSGNDAAPDEEDGR